MSSDKYSVAVIGAGAIGSSWDNPGSGEMLTHAHAFSTHPQTSLVGFVDTDFARGKAEAAKWGTTFYRDITLLYQAVRPDIVVIATPDATHAEMLKTVLKNGARAVVCEKPIATSAREAAEVRATLATNTVPVIINFPRRFDPSVARLQRELMEGTHGRIISAHVAYAKGTHHIGSHLFDLVRLLFGELTAAAAHFKIEDYPNDPTFGGAATFERCGQVHIQAMDGRKTSMLELEILTDTKRIRFVDRGYAVETQDIIPDPVFPGFRMWGPTRHEATGLSSATSELAKHVVNLLDGTEAPRASAEDAFKTFDACQRFVDSYQPL